MRSYLFALAFSCAVIFVLTALFDIEPLASVVLAAIMFGVCAIALWLYRGRRRR
jgi:hypothetical protein